jgi:hypothetical protein
MPVPSTACMSASDDGDRWQSLRLNLPDTQVSDLVIEENDLVIATHGRSFCILDNLAILRQADPKLTASALHLFQPDTAIRSFRPATIDYYLQKPADKVTVSILDARGKLVRTYTPQPMTTRRRKHLKTTRANSGHRGQYHLERKQERIDLPGTCGIRVPPYSKVSLCGVQERSRAPWRSLVNTRFR